MYMLLCLGGRNVHVLVPGRKECTCYCVWEEGMYMLLCLGGRNVHVTVSGRKECTCSSVWEEGMYTMRGRKKCASFYLPRLGGRNVLCCYCVRVKEICMLLLRLGGRNVLAAVSGFVPLSPTLCR